MSITLNNVDMENSVITIQSSKHYKSRLVPFNKQVKGIIKEYLQWRIKKKFPTFLGSYFFIGTNHQAFNISTMENIFQRIREKAGVKRNDNATFQPRIHDLRHTFAVNRLTSWYRENKDVQQLLPILSVYLGHRYLAHTSVYLKMTDELLQEANMRFEKYSIGEQK